MNIVNIIIEKSFSINANSFFLPHHAVLKESRTTTKLLVVFEGSCKLHDELSISCNI